jgi:hypothetical protein
LISTTQSFASTPALTTCCKIATSLADEDEEDEEEVDDDDDDDDEEDGDEGVGLFSFASWIVLRSCWWIQNFRIKDRKSLYRFLTTYHM